MWYGVLDSKEVKKNKPLFAKRLNKNLVLWRDENNNICCIEDKCCHRGLHCLMEKYAVII